MRLAGIKIGGFFRSPNAVSRSLEQAKRLDQLSSEIAAHAATNSDLKKIAPQLDEWRNLRRNTEDMGGLPDTPQGRAFINYLVSVERELTDGLADMLLADPKKAYQHAVQIKVLRAQIHGIEKLSETHQSGVRKALNALKARANKGESHV